MDLALKGINYFQTYYQNLLLFTVSIAMIGWMFSLYQQLNISNNTDSNETQSNTKSSKSTVNWIVVTVIILLFAYGKFKNTFFVQKYPHSPFDFGTFHFSAQKMTLIDSIFLVLPVFCWFPVRTFNIFHQLTKFETWFWICGIELLV